MTRKKVIYIVCVRIVEFLKPFDVISIIIYNNVSLSLILDIITIEYILAIDMKRRSCPNNTSPQRRTRNVSLFFLVIF